MLLQVSELAPGWTATSLTFSFLGGFVERAACHLNLLDFDTFDSHCGQILDFYLGGVFDQGPPSAAFSLVDPLNPNFLVPLSPVRWTQ